MLDAKARTGNARKNRQTAHRLTVDNRHLELNTQKSEALAHQAEINLTQRLSTAFEGRRYYLEGNIDETTVKDCIGTLATWRRIDQDSHDKRIHIFINANGPAAIPALALYDYLKELRKDGFEIVAEVNGQAKGQAAMVLQAATTRLASPLSRIVLEELETTYSGHTFVMNKRLEFMTAVQRQVVRLTVNRSRITTRRMVARTKNSTWILGANEALELGLIDAVANNNPCAPAAPDTATEESKSRKLADRRSAAELRRLDAEAQLAEISLKNLEASAENSSFYQFFTRFSDTSCSEAKQAISRFAQRPDSDITILINSPGGSVVDGFGLIDIIKQVRASGQKVTTACVGYAASMGGVTLQAGDWRVMSENGWLLIHNVSSGFSDSISECTKTLAESYRLQRQCFELLAERSTMTADEIFEQCLTHDWWIPAKEALKRGFIDEIR